jgi:hypothetical protein
VIHRVLIIVAALLAVCPVLAQGPAGEWRSMDHLPELGALDAHPDSGLVALAPGENLLLHLGPGGEVWRRAGGSGRGAGALRAPADLDASQNLRILVLDRDNRRLAGYSRSLAPLSSRPLVPDRDGDCDQPGLLAAGGAGLLLLADPGPGLRAG